MVFTRSKARQLALESTQSPPRECETPQTPRKVLERGAKSSTRTSRKSAVIRLSPVATPMKQWSRQRTDFRKFTYSDVMSK